MKRILFVTDAWEPQRNGVVSVLQAIIPILKARGYEVSVIEPGQFITVPTPLYPEIPLALFPRRRVAKMIREINPDFVCLVTEGPLGWAARAECVKRGIPFVSWYHTHFQLYVDVYLRWLLRPVSTLLRHFHSAAVHTMVSTESLKRELESVGFKNLVIMPLGIDTTLVTRNLAAPVSPLPKPVFAYVGRVAAEKSVEEFLRLDLPGTKVVLGGGPLLAELKKKYTSVHFFGRYRLNKDFVDQLSLVDVFVFPSRTETFGLVVLEALACGIPVAAHDVMGPRDIVTNGVDGYLSENLQEAAIKCLDLSPESCRKKAEQFSWEHSVDSFIKHLIPRYE